MCPQKQMPNIGVWTRSSLVGWNFILSTQVHKAKSKPSISKLRISCLTFIICANKYSLIFFQIWFLILRQKEIVQENIFLNKNSNINRNVESNWRKKECPFQVFCLHRLGLKGRFVFFLKWLVRWVWFSTAGTHFIRISICKKGITVPFHQ